MELMAFSMDLWRCPQYPPTNCDDSHKCRCALNTTSVCFLFCNVLPISPRACGRWRYLDPSLHSGENTHIDPVQESDDDVFDPSDFELNDSSPEEEPVCNTPNSSSARSGFTSDGTARYTEVDDA